MTDGKHGELQTRGHANFVEDVGEVVFDRRFADGEELGDVLVCDDTTWIMNRDNAPKSCE